MTHAGDLGRSTAEAQLDMFGGPAIPGDPDTESLRAELAGILAEATSRERLDGTDAMHFRNIFSRMAHRLPDAEAAQLRLQLETELARLVA